MKAFDYLAELLCPNSCCCCKDVLYPEDELGFCNECYENLKLRVIDVSKDLKCKYIDNYYFYFRYDSWYVKHLIRHAKYVSSKPFLNYIGQCGQESLKKHNLLNQIDIITFAPRRKREARFYTFDQSMEIAKAFSSKTNIPWEQLLDRKGFAKAQKKLKSKQRAQNAVGKYKCTRKLNGETVLLIDDVVTTGSTVSECAKLLKENGAGKVYVWSIAQ